MYIIVFCSIFNQPRLAGWSDLITMFQSGWNHKTYLFPLVTSCRLGNQRHFPCLAAVQQLVQHLLSCWPPGKWVTSSIWSPLGLSTHGVWDNRRHFLEGYESIPSSNLTYNGTWPILVPRHGGNEKNHWILGHAIVGRIPPMIPDLCRRTLPVFSTYHRTQHTLSNILNSWICTLLVPIHDRIHMLHEGFLESHPNHDPSKREWEATHSNIC